MNVENRGPNEYVEGMGQDFGTPCKSAKQLIRWKQIMEKVKVVAVVVLKGTVAVALFITNSTIFSVGFLIGVVLDKQVDYTINKIILVWRQQALTMSCITAFAAFLSLPVTWAAGSFLYAAYLGCSISKKAQKNWDKKHPDQLFNFWDEMH